MTKNLGFLAILFLVPSFLSAHAPRPGSPVHGVTLLGGAFMDEAAEGGHHPYVSGRYERWLSRFVGFEGGLTHARAERRWVSQATFESRLVPTSYSSADIGLQLQAPLRYVRPYLGITLGGTYYDAGRIGDREVGVTHAVVSGARIGRYHGTSVRAEFRLRRDDFARSVSYNAEYGAGLVYSF